MKKIILIGAIVASSLAASAAPEPTEKVKLAFTHAFADATDVKWTESKKTYEVSFSYFGVATKVQYDADGKILAAERETKVALLPMKVVQKLQAAYPGLEFKSVTEVNKKKKVYYLIKLEAGGDLCTIKANMDGSLKLLNRCEL